MKSAPLVPRKSAISSRLFCVVLVFCSIWLNESLRPCARFSVSTDSSSEKMVLSLAEDLHLSDIGSGPCDGVPVAGIQQAETNRVVRRVNAVAKTKLEFVGFWISLFTV